MRRRYLLAHLILLPFLSSCGIFGIHFNVHNPRKPGKYPKFSKETILLGENTTIRKNFDVTFYDLDIALDPGKQSLSGWVEIKAIANENIDSVQIDLDQPLLIDELRWQTREGQLLTYSRNYRAVYVKLPKRTAKKNVFSLHIKYHGKPVIARKPPWDGGLVWKKDKQKKHWAGVACEGEGASTWFPCKDHTSDEPDSARMCFSIPDTTLTVVSNGVFTGSSIKNNLKSFCWKVSYPINLYNITFYLGDFAKIEDTYTGINGKKLLLNYYVLKPNASFATEHFKQVKKHIRIYEELYGEYSWYRDGFKLIESPYAGMEHQTAIAYGNGYKNDLNGKDDYILLHETGHEWFGNAITAEDLADVWLQEGITTYGEFLYLEKAHSSDEAYSHLSFYRMMIKNKRPLVGPAGRRYFDYHDGDVYVKGAWMLHSLRTNIANDSLFFAVLKTFYAENKLKVTNSQTFIQTVNRITGKDYNWFFNQYLYKNKVPFLEYYRSEDGTLYYRWTDVGEDFNKQRITVEFKPTNESYNIYPGTSVKKLQRSQPGNSTDLMYFSEYKTLFGVKKNKKLIKIYEKQGKAN